eukprot:scaffold190_cov171-Amphora_coffeaeformis.AAC.11
MVWYDMVWGVEVTGDRFTRVRYYVSLSCTGVCCCLRHHHTASDGGGCFVTPPARPTDAHTKKEAELITTSERGE